MAARTGGRRQAAFPYGAGPGRPNALGPGPAGALKKRQRHRRDGNG